jgi:hypothetical protein
MAAATARTVTLTEGTQHTVSMFTDADALSLGFAESSVVLRSSKTAVSFEMELTGTWIMWVFGELGLGPRIRDMWIAAVTMENPNASAYAMSWPPGVGCHVRVALERFDMSVAEAFTRYGHEELPGVEEQLLHQVVRAANETEFTLHDTKGSNILLRRETSGMWKVRLHDVNQNDIMPDIKAACRMLFALAKLQAHLGCDLGRGAPLIAERVESLARENPICANTIFNYTGPKDNTQWLAGPLELRSLVLSLPCHFKQHSENRLCIVDHGVVRRISVHEACSMRPIGSNISAARRRLCPWTTSQYLQLHSTRSRVPFKQVTLSNANQY